MDTESTRFGGISRLYGKKMLETLNSCNVAVVGIGGVGSWVAEALVRSGIGSISLIDLDEVCETNINRQIHAVTETIGKSKVKVMAERLVQINPSIKVEAIEDFITPDTVYQLISEKYDLVVDAIDSLGNKAQIVVACKEKKIPLITCGGAGGKRDPMQVKSQDLGLTLDDKLLYRLRKKLKRDFGFPRGRKKFGVTAIFSQEKPVFPDGDGGVCDVAPEDSTRLDCFTGLGAATHVTATFGMVASYKAIEILLNKEADEA